MQFFNNLNIPYSLKSFTIVIAFLVLFFNNAITSVLAATSATSSIKTTAPAAKTWQIYLQAPTQHQGQTLWQGQASQWLIVSLNPPSGKVKLELPASDDFSFLASAAIAMNEDGKTGWAYPLRITAKKSGDLTIPAFSLSSLTQTLTTARHTVEVKAPQSTNRMQLTVSTNKKEIFLGQSIRLTTSLTFDYPLAALKSVNLHLPALLNKTFTIAKPWNKADEKSKKSIGLPVNGQRQIAHWKNLPNNKVRIYFDTVIKPSTVGQYQLAPATILASVEDKLAQANNKVFKGTQYLAYYNNKFFEPTNSQKVYHRVLAKSLAMTINVKALPTNAPAHFSGIVGRPIIEASAKPTRVKKGETIQYTLMLVHPDIETITLPSLSENPSFNQSFNLPGDASVSTNKSGGKIINQSLFPRRADIAVIPAVTLNYFEPATGLYRDLLIDSLPITVTANDEFNFSDIEGNKNISLKNTVTPDDDGIWALRWEKSARIEDKTDNTIKLLTNQPWLLLFLLLLPPFIVGLLLIKPMQQHFYQRRALQPIYRLKTSLDQGGDPLLPLSRYCYDRFGLAPSRFNADNLQLGLDSYNKANNITANDLLAFEFSKWLRQYQTRYAQKATNLSWQELKQLFELVNKLDKTLPHHKTSDKRNTTIRTAASTLFNIITGTILIATLFYTSYINQAVASEVVQGEQINDISIEALHTAHQQALQLDIDSPHKGHLAHAKIAQQLAGLIEDSSLDKASLLYDIGTSWFQANHYGQSILWLRRAENAAPNDVTIKHNLAQARAKRLEQLPDNFSPTWLNQLHGITSQPFWLGLCWLSYFFFWLLIWRRFTYGTNKDKTDQRKSVENKHFLLALTFLGIASMSQIARYHFIPQQSKAVITTQEVIARKGPGLIFSPAFTASLHQGSELVLLRNDGQWSEVKLTNGEICWLPRRALTVI